jgi:hypothetical protein
MKNYKQNRVSSVVWPWTQSVVVSGPDVKRKTRREAVIQVAVMWTVAVVFFLFLSKVMAGVVLGISLIVLTTGLFYQKGFRAIQTGLRRFGAWVGAVLTWLLMTPFFYLAFFPARIVLLLKGKDPMTRQFPSAQGSMWVKHKMRDSEDRYERQF